MSLVTTQWLSVAVGIPESFDIVGVENAWINSLSVFLIIRIRVYDGWGFLSTSSNGGVPAGQGKDPILREQIFDCVPTLNCTGCQVAK